MLKMFEDKRLGLALIIIGVLANNYVYLHDLVVGKDEILLGSNGVIGIIVTLAVIAIGMVSLLRSQASDAGE